MDAAPEQPRMTRAEQLAYFERMIDICDRAGWMHLAELVYQQYIKMQVENA